MKKPKSFGVRQDVGQERKIVEVKQLLLKREEFESKSSGFLSENMGGKQFSIEELLIVTSSLFLVILLCINSSFPYEK